LVHTNTELTRALIDRCRRGDNRAQYELYRTYAKAMYNSCLRITGNTTDAEDVLQEAFIEAFTHLHTYRHEASFGAWLRRIVVNRAVNYLKKRKLFLPGHLPDEQETTEDEAYDTHTDAQQICDAMALLPDGYRIVLNLYLLEGYDHEEIGQIMGITVSTSKSQYSRAKKKLAEILKKQEHEKQY